MGEVNLAKLACVERYKFDMKQIENAKWKRYGKRGPYEGHYCRTVGSDQVLDSNLMAY